MSSEIKKPYVLRVAELIYLKIFQIKKNSPEINNIQAFEIFMTSKDFNLISSGKFHDDWFLELKNNKFIDKITDEKINNETIKLIKIPELYYTKSHFPLDLSQRAFDHLWRVCESYELWCKETKQEKLITLNILD